MQTIAFETQPMNGWIQIPDTFKDWYDKAFKVILLRDESPQLVPQVAAITLMQERSEAPSGDSVSHWATWEDAEVGLEGEALETFQKIRDIAKHCAALPDLDTRSPDEILGYNEYGGFD
jgi:hypothetical protein